MPVAVVSVLAGASTVLLTLADVGAIATRERDWIDAGGNVWEVQGDGLDAGACDALDLDPVVEAAGAVVARRRLAFASSPGHEFLLVDATRGLAQVGWPFTGRFVESLAAAQVRAGLGLADGALVVPVPDGPAPAGAPIRIDEVQRTEGRLEDLERAVVRFVAPVGTATSCLVEGAPGRADAARSVALVALAGGGRIFARPLVEDQVVTWDADDELRDRRSRHTWAMASSVVGSAMLGSWTARRRELAVYRLFGLDHARFGLLLSIECLVIGLVPYTWGALLAFAFWGDVPAPAVTVALVTNDLVRVASATVLLPLVGLLIGRRSPLAVLRSG